MGEGKLKAAVLGLDDNGRLLLEAASQMDCFEIGAVADKDANLAEETGDQYKCAWYDDYRQMIMQNQFDCLLAAAGLHTCDEHVKMAIKKKCNILKLAPPARNFEEAVELVRLAENENVKFAVANTGRFARSFLALRESVQQGRIEQICLITAVATAINRRYPAWQADPKLAGGGVLLHNCYGIIDQIVWNFGMPERVFAMNISTAGDRQQRLYLTEDTALLTMRFSETFIASLTASRHSTLGPERELLAVYGKDTTLTVSDSKLSINDLLGQTSEQQQYDDSKFFRMTRLLENFALSVISPDKDTLCSSGKENLRNMAVIESAYLSARTGMPEEPQRVLERARLEPADIGPARPEQ
ncbi:MAG TPA: Gfo/Idh/MocA family oxidoreductase [Sedimentisphaerales bacterium]|nr:Gfo/Idh/MocA family oxidoreductase [Sedimentisphaerales bacterium]